MRRLLVSLLLLALIALAVTPARLPLRWGGPPERSSASGPSERKAELCVAERAGQLRIAAPLGRHDLAAPVRPIPVAARSARVAPSAALGFLPEQWQPDRRESIRRVRWRVVPPVPDVSGV